MTGIPAFLLRTSDIRRPELAWPALSAARGYLTTSTLLHLRSREPALHRIEAIGRIGVEGNDGVRRMPTHQIDHDFEELEHRRRLANATPDDDAGILRRRDLLDDLLDGALLIQSDETEIRRYAGGLESRLPECERAANHVGIDAEVRNGVRVEADDEDALDRGRIERRRCLHGSGEDLEVMTGLVSHLRVG